jgi:hypothetical protein
MTPSFNLDALAVYSTLVFDVPLTVIGQGVCVQFQITCGLQQQEREFFQGWDVLETPRLSPLPKMHQTHDSSLGNSVEKLFACDPEQEQALRRRIRLPTVP